MLILSVMIVTTASAQTFKKNYMKVTINSQEYHVKVNNDPMVAQILAMCPMTLAVNRSGDHEYYGRLPQKADDRKSRQTSEAHKNELMYFGGWNCLTLLFEDVNVTPYKLVKLGEFEEDITDLLKSSPAEITVRIEAM